MFSKTDTARRQLGDLIQTYQEKQHDETLPESARDAWWMALLPLEHAVRGLQTLEYSLRWSLYYDPNRGQMSEEMRAKKFKAYLVFVTVLNDLGIDPDPALGPQTE